MYKIFFDYYRVNHLNPVIVSEMEKQIMLKTKEEIDNLTHKIIGCAMQVHRVLGNGFQEVIYQRYLAIELQYQELNFEREKEMPIFYREKQVGTRRVNVINRSCK